MGRTYNAKIYNECKRMFVEQNMSPAAIADFKQGKPSKQTVSLWAKKKDRQGRDWHDLRLAYRDKMYEAISPQNIAAKLMDRLMDLLSEENWNEKSADQLAKLHSTLQKVLEPRYQIPTMYHMLSEMLKFFSAHYPQIVDKNFKFAVQDFKNHLRASITNEK